MFRKGNKIMSTLFGYKTLQKRYSSALFVMKDKAMEMYSVLIPYLDCDKRFNDLKTLEENIQRREMNVNINELKELWDFYKQWTQSKEILEKKRVQVAVKVNKVNNSPENETKESELKRLKLEGKLLKEELKDVNKAVIGVEEIVILQALNLPNVLHPKVPTDKEVLEELKQEIETISGRDHLTVGKSLNCIDYHNAVTCYLKNDAAQFELATGFFVKNYFESNAFIPFANPDFAKSVLVEGVSLSPINPYNALLLKDTDQGLMYTLHLTGGASLFSFCAFHSKHTVVSESLPARYVTVGRCYNPKPISSLGGLYSVWQSNSAEVFVALGNNDDEMNLEFDKTLELYFQLYKTLSIDFRIVNQPAKLLKPWESLRYSFEIYSHTNDTFVEVGHLSIVDDFISKRLRLCYTDEHQQKFLKLISGTVINVPVLLALCLERSSDTLFFPEVIKKFKIL